MSDTLRAQLGQIAEDSPDPRLVRNVVDQAALVTLAAVEARVAAYRYQEPALLVIADLRASLGEPSAPQADARDLAMGARINIVTACNAALSLVAAPHLLTIHKDTGEIGTIEIAREPRS